MQNVEIYNRAPYGSSLEWFNLGKAVYNYGNVVAADMNVKKH
jgi:surface antigen